MHHKMKKKGTGQVAWNRDWQVGLRKHDPSINCLEDTQFTYNDTKKWTAG